MSLIKILGFILIFYAIGAFVINFGLLQYIPFFSGLSFLTDSIPSVFFNPFASLISTVIGGNWLFSVFAPIINAIVALVWFFGVLGLAVSMVK